MITHKDAQTIFHDLEYQIEGRPPLFVDTDIDPRTDRRMYIWKLRLGGQFFTRNAADVEVLLMQRNQLYHDLLAGYFHEKRPDEKRFLADVIDMCDSVNLDTTYLENLWKKHYGNSNN